MGLAVQGHESGVISKEVRDEIVMMLDKTTFEDWRPLIYVIPYSIVATRVRIVPRDRRASHEMEYIIEELADGEFDIIEPIQ